MPLAPTRLAPLVLVVLAVAGCGSGGSAERKLALVDADELAARVCAVAIAAPCRTRAVGVHRVAKGTWRVRIEGGQNGVECDSIELAEFSVSELRGVTRFPC